MRKKVGKAARVAFYRFCRFICFLTFKVLYRLEVRGRAHVPQRGPLIVAANHKSYADPPLVGVALPRDSHYLAKRSLFSFPPIGWLLKLWNAHPISRAGGAEAIKEAVLLLAEKDAVILFPEGKRVRDEEFGRPKAGVGMLALNTKTPVIPVYIHNSDKLFQLKKLTVVFGRPLHPDESHAYHHLAEQIMSEIKRLKETHFPSLS